MSKKGIALSPNNYRIWFEYFRGSMQELKEHIDTLLKDGASFDEELHEEIFNKFLHRDFSAEDEKKLEAEIRAVDEANKASRNILEPIANDLNGLSETGVRYSGKLSDIIEEAAELAETDDIEKIITRLMDETSKMSSENDRMSVELKKSTSQLDELRKNLKSAKVEARIDDLTRLPNRRALNERMTDELKNVTSSTASCVAIMDVDKFKRINDSYGHAIGDKALCAIANQIRESIRSTDIIYRYGGEEFAVIMPNTTLSRATSRLNEIRKGIESHEFCIRDVVEIITVSIGIASIDPSGTITSNFEMADDAMYLAKQSGRNNVKTEEDCRRQNA
jgi:diguanylate cyclase